MDTLSAGRNIEPVYLEKAITYPPYIMLVGELLTQGRTTGPDQSAQMIHYTQLNQQRMHRLDKSIVVLPSAEAWTVYVAA